jgi:hypothetical protein
MKTSNYGFQENDCVYDIPILPLFTNLNFLPIFEADIPDFQQINAVAPACH